ncbi:DEAD/DEAH box helicase [Thiolinea disciformis]|uniref:DEAD/DEAH box helicase n=1 Tax=Thiolinea disciformis TaxID=125614 RepID=UPI0003707291|nr:DEAD/DEAH box helicase [Thiolinea disciformis]
MLKQEYIRALRHNGFPPEMVLVSFDATTIQRGTYYFEAGRVMELQSSFPSLSEVALSSIVLGNAKYNTEVQLDLNHHRILSHCSCPVGAQCKHGMATVLQYVRQQIKVSPKSTLPKLAEPSALQLWLADLNTPEPKKHLSEDGDDPEVGRMDLIYLLDQTLKRDNRVPVQVRKANRLKRGGYGQGYLVQFEDLLYSWKNHPFRYTELDVDIAQLVIPHTSTYTQNQQRLYLKGALGELALKLLLQTGRVFWQKPELQALKLAPERNAQIVWEERKKISHIKLQILPPAQDFFWLERLYYVDTLRGECGPLSHEPLTPLQMIKLLAAPPIPSAEAEQVSRGLLEILPDADMPLPDTRLNPETHDIDVDEPIPHLQLYSTQEQANTQHHLHLELHYGEHVLAPDPSKNLHLKRQDQIRYRIHRQTDQEQTILERLSSFGFEPALAHQYSEWIMPADHSALGALRWNHFLEEGLEHLKTSGWQIDQAPSFSLDFTEADDWEAELQAQGQDWFELSLGFLVDGKRINLLPILVEMLAHLHNPQELRELLLAQGSLLVPLEDQRWIKLDAQRILQVLDNLIELYDKQALNADGNLVLSRFHGANLSELLNDPRLQWKGATEFKILANKLADFKGIKTVELPLGLKAELRPYQHEGLNWLQFLREFQFNGVLADDMGLGKTLQALAHLLVEKKSSRALLPSLVIAPTSLMSNWRRETEKFTPELKVLTLHGTERHQAFEQLKDYDLVLTTYPLILRDEALYRGQQFYYLILDEAQAIKNAKAKTTQVIYEIQSTHRLCLTGTPMENHLGELWSMFHFLMPGFLGTHDRFGRLFRVPIERQGDHERQQVLRRRMQPFMLRRTKEKVAHELPPKTEIIRTVALSGEQRDLYETVRLAMDAKVREEISQKGFARSHIMILDALLKLRQVCCDPRLLKLEHTKQINGSAKLELLMDMLDELLEEGRKVLIFSQFTSMLALIENELIANNISFSKLTGQTRHREEAIDAFQQGPAQVFLISLKAGGTGLNLTAADTVIHYDPWWNPAVEQQATDRAYRIGQDKPVFVYKLLTEETVEEKILHLQHRKQALADGLYHDTEAGLAFGQAELLDLLKPLDTF